LGAVKQPEKKEKEKELDLQKYKNAHSNLNPQKNESKLSDNSPPPIVNNSAQIHHKKEIEINKQKSQDKNEIKDYFSKNKSQQQDKQPQVSSSNTKEANASLEEVEFELNYKNKNETPDNKLKNFIKNSKSNQISKDMESSHKMLIELSRLAIEEANPQEKKLNIKNSNSSNKIDNHSQEKANTETESAEYLEKNLKNQEEEDEIKDEIFVKNTRSSTENSLSKNTSNNQKNDNQESDDEEEVAFDCSKMVFTSKDEIEKLTKELIEVLGEFVFKSAYKLVYENVSLSYYF